MEQWRDSGYFEWLDTFEGKFEDQYFGFEDGGIFDHRSYFGFEGDEGFDWYCEDDVVFGTMWCRDGDWG